MKQTIETMIHGHQKFSEIAHSIRVKELAEAKKAKMPRIANQLHHKQNIKEANPQTSSNSTAYFFIVWKFKLWRSLWRQIPQ